MHIVIWMVSALFALAAGITDLRWRRIPNWLTYPAAPIALSCRSTIGLDHQERLPRILCRP